MSKKKIYTIVLIASLSGFIYLFLNTIYGKNIHFGLCIFKNVTGFPCPSCGTTRAIQLILQGKVIKSLYMNPFGIIVVVMMTIAPFWILYDLIAEKESFLLFYKKSEETIRIKWLSIVLIILVVINWIWNIYKGL
jgi:hypothetical protein